MLYQCWVRIIDFNISPRLTYIGYKEFSNQVEVKGKDKVMNMSFICRVRVRVGVDVSSYALYILCMYKWVNMGVKIGLHEYGAFQSEER